MRLPLYFSRVYLTAVLVFSNLNLPTVAQDVCVTQDQPNPIFNQYPNNVTGALNTTLAIVPIPLALARKIIPPQYAILVNAYRTLMPDFPVDMYPAMIQTGHDHDIRFQNLGFPDFSKAGFEFPFLDILGDGSSSFRWAPEQMISADNLAAIRGSEAYGTKVHPATFNPPCDAYGYLSDCKTYFNGFSSSRFISLLMRRVDAHEPYPYQISLFNNIINQPTFANGSSCNQQIRLFNTSLTQAPYHPVPVRVTIHSNLGPFQYDVKFPGLAGFQVSTAFIEKNQVPCETFRGYQPPASI